jgi:hypothetical protein
VNRVERKNCRSCEGQPLILEEPRGQPEQQAHNESVEQQIRKVESVGKHPEQLVTDQEAKNADGAIVVCCATRAEVRQDSRAEDFSHVGKTADIGIGQNLMVVVIDESIL